MRGVSARGCTGGSASGTTVGVLALQGASEAHLAVFADLGVPAREVRAPADLEGVTHLVLPGGESTTIRHLLDLFDLTDELLRRHRAGELVILGSCAGAILLGRDDGRRPPRLELLDIALERNAYGSQARSFVTEVAVAGLAAPVRGLFIRAPRIVETGENVEVLARFDGDPVVVEGPGALAVTFHPELARDSGVHERFLAMKPQRSEPTPTRTRTTVRVVGTVPVNAGRAGSGA